VRTREQRKAAREAGNAALDAADRAAAAKLAGVSLDRPSYPLFTEAAPDGKCPHCHGSQFRRPAITDGGSAWLGLAGLAVSAASARYLVDCVTCGKRFRRG
jgi:hypothetical protein